MRPATKEPGVVIPGISMENAWSAAEMLKVLFPRSLDDAVTEAANNPEFQDPHKIYIYFPCSVIFQKEPFERLLQGMTDPKEKQPYEFSKVSRVRGRPIYSSWSAALSGASLNEATQKFMPHPSFLILNVPTNLIVDYVARSGETLMTPRLRKHYLGFLEGHQGRSLEWHPPAVE